MKPPKMTYSALTIVLAVHAILLAILFPCMAKFKVDRTVLDIEQDILHEDWMGGSCVYLEDSSDYFAYGCPSHNSLNYELQSKKGFWSPCRGYCSIQYYGGLKRKPIKIHIRGFVEGGGKVTIYGRNNPNLQENNREIASFASSSGTWFDESVDIALLVDIFVLEFYSTSSLNFVVIERIEIEYYEEDYDGTPEPGNGFVLDTEESMTGKDGRWKSNCHYEESSQYFEAFGCQTSVSGNSGQGYWTTCKMSLCSIDFMMPSSLYNSIVIQIYLHGTAQLTVKGKTEDGDQSIIIGRISNASHPSGWLQQTFCLAKHPTYKVIQFELPGSYSSEGFVLIDRIHVNADSCDSVDNRSNAAQCGWLHFFLICMYTFY